MNVHSFRPIQFDSLNELKKKNHQFEACSKAKEK